MPAVLKRLIGRWGLRDAAVRAQRLARRVSRTCLGIDRALVRAHLTASRVRKLHIGCGKRPLAGWLNADVEPGAGVMLLDAARRFPLESDTFDFIYSEHMIEHVPYQAGSMMLRECHRVLRPGGVLRISTPDLAFLIRLYARPDLPLHRRYIDYTIGRYVPDAPEPSPAFVVNNFVRDWEHQFIHDEATLRRALTDAGFGGIRRCAIQTSEQQALTQLENVSRMPQGFLELESLIMEAAKMPTAGGDR